MSTNIFTLDDFKDCFVAPVARLLPEKHSGLPLLMIAFPLIDRYLRQKSGVREKNLRGARGESFWQELLAVFPALKTPKNAETFWDVYRHGIVHQATFSHKEKTGVKIGDAWLSDENEPIVIVSPCKFHVDPRKFASAVLQIIEKDFLTFLGLDSVNHPLARGRHSSGSPGHTASSDEELVGPKPVIVRHETSAHCLRFVAAAIIGVVIFVYDVREDANRQLEQKISQILLDGEFSNAKSEWNAQMSRHPQFDPNGTS